MCLLQQNAKHIVRSGAFCSLAAVGVSALGVKYLDDLGATVVSDTDAIAMTSVFLEKLSQVRARACVHDIVYVML